MKIVFFLALIIVSSPVLAHLDAGEDKAINGYIADFGYSPSHPVSGKSTAFAVNLANGTTEEAVNVTSDWVRISQGNDVLFAGTFNADDGSVSFSYTFPKPGIYDISVKFSMDGQELAQSEFQVDVGGQQEISIYLAAILSVILGILIGRHAFRKK